MMKMAHTAGIGVCGLFCFLCPGCDEKISNYRREGVCMQLHRDETVLVKTAATKMKK